MDCEKFESALMDELYGELDELTSAATRRHIEGCARCAALMSGLRATRRVAALPRLDPPPDLERRILAAAAGATPKVVPFRGRMARAVSLAGSWAMRPQTAMAAVFLVMIGTSVLLLRGKSSRAPASTFVTVTEEGTPAPATPPATDLIAPPPDPASSPAASAVVAARSQDRVATAASPAGAAGGAGATGGVGTTGPWAQPPAELFERAPAKPGVAKGDDIPGAVALNAAPRRAIRESADLPSPAPPAQAAPAPGVGFAVAPASEAEKAAEPAAPADPADELWAARAARDAAARQGRPCPSGPRFDDVASRSPGSPTGWDALYEGALCYEGAGDYGSARTRLGTLLGVPSHRDRARYTLDRINKEQRGGSASAARAAPKAAPAAPPPAAAAPAATDSTH